MYQVDCNILDILLTLSNNMKQITWFTVSNKAFTNQMLGQQLMMWLWQEFGQTLEGYYKYHKITICSTDSHLNHQIFVRKHELIDLLTIKAKQLFGKTIVIKDIMFVARGKENGEEYEGWK